MKIEDQNPHFSTCPVAVEDIYTYYEAEGVFGKSNTSLIFMYWPHNYLRVIWFGMYKTHTGRSKARIGEPHLTSSLNCKISRVGMDPCRSQSPVPDTIHGKLKIKPCKQEPWQLHSERSWINLKCNLFSLVNAELNYLGVFLSNICVSEYKTYTTL